MGKILEVQPRRKIVQSGALADYESSRSYVLNNLELAVLLLDRAQTGGVWKDSCFANLKPGEPFFVLRGQDILGSMGVRDWAARAEHHGCPRAKVNEANDTAGAMEDWPDRKYPD